MSNEPDFIRSSAVMAAGTLVSRLTGLIRNLLLVAALGTSIFADTLVLAAYWTRSRTARAPKKIKCKLMKNAYHHLLRGCQAVLRVTM